MDDKRMTMAQLAEKYDTDEGTVSTALSTAGMLKGKKTKDFPESEAVAALIALFRRRSNSFKELADMWKGKATRTEVIYEEGE